MKAKQIITNAVHKALNAYGFQLHRLPNQEEILAVEAANEIKSLLWLRKYKINTVLDIGANAGYFAERIQRVIPEARIYSFEPLRECYEELVKKFKKNAKCNAFHFALGNETGEIEIYKNEYSASSSLLKMADLHKESFPFTKNTIIEKVRVFRLNDVADQMNLEPPILIKMDVQGYEDKVIEGGEAVLRQADIVITELSVEKLYENQPLFDDIYKMMLNLGFQYQGNYEQLNHPEDGRILQMDGIFIKRSNHNRVNELVST
jgi:FkbM family methyltransferase